VFKRLKNSGKSGFYGRLKALNDKKSTIKHLIWTLWTPPGSPVDQEVAGSTPVSHPNIWDILKRMSHFCYIWGMLIRFLPDGVAQDQQDDQRAKNKPGDTNAKGDDNADRRQHYNHEKG
jgi:hypothetical protein